MNELNPEDDHETPTVAGVVTITSRSRQAGAPPSATSEANVWRP
jgi:hypothetical protein